MYKKILLFCFVACLMSSCHSRSWLTSDLGQPIVSFEKTRKLSSFNPVENEFPGGRGPHHLVVYTPEYGDKTGTNEWGSEAIVQDGVITAIGGNNSIIPENGLVISGNESASIWINKNLEVGMEVEIAEASILKYTRTENTDIEKARRLNDKVNERIQKLKGQGQGHDLAGLQNLEDEVSLAFNQFLAAKNNGEKDLLMSRSREVLELVQSMYYQTFASKEEEFRGVWVRLVDKTPEELIKTIHTMADAGINAILPETIYDGHAIYPNAHEFLPQLPQFVGWDPMQVMIDECKKVGIEVIPWCEMFFVGGKNSPLVHNKSEWLGQFRHGSPVGLLEEGFHYFCPSRPEVHEFLLQVLDQLSARYPLDGIQLDYIRYSLSEPWQNGMCYCEYCQECVRKERGFDIMKITPDNEEEWAQWNAYRVNNITRFVDSVNGLFKHKYPDVVLSADVFPDSNLSLRQKFQDWKHWVDNDLIDDIYTMSYSPRLEDIVAEADLLMENVQDSKVRPIVGLGPYLGFQPELLLKQIEIAREAGAEGVCLFSYNALTSEHLSALKQGPFRKVISGNDL